MQFRRFGELSDLANQNYQIDLCLEFVKVYRTNYAYTFASPKTCIEKKVSWPLFGLCHFVPFCNYSGSLDFMIRIRFLATFLTKNDDKINIAGFLINYLNSYASLIFVLCTSILNFSQYENSIFLAFYDYLFFMFE